MIDFSDMLLAPLAYDSRFPKYDWVLIDEAQDISPIRLEIIRRMVRKGTRVVAVGDPHQAIYGFTGADSDSMDSISTMFDSDTLPLSVTYRCPKVVVSIAQEWVPQIQAHESSPEGIHRTVFLKPGIATDPGWASTPEVQPLPFAKQPAFWDCGPFSHDDVIVCRNTRPIVELAYQFLQKSLPAMVEGRDIGQGLIKLATRWKLTGLDELEIRLQEYAAKEKKKFLAMKQEGRAAQVEDQVETVNCLITATRESGGERIQDLIDLINRMFGDTPEGTKPKCLTLCTVHKSKGREWDRVFILGRNRYMPSKFARQKWEVKQETHLQYVAVTRVKVELIDVVVPEK